MKSLCHFLLALLLTTGVAAAAASSPPPLLVDTPGSQFKAHGKAKVKDLPDGLRVKGESFAEVTLAGVLLLPGAEMAERRASRLTVHFRTSPHGPSLRKLILPDGSAIDLNLSGNFLADSKRNTIDFGDIPIQVFDRSILRLVIGFPGGIDSQIDPGEFVLKGITVGYVRKPGVRAQAAARDK